MGNYNDNVDDCLVLNVTAMLVDDVNCEGGATLNFQLNLNLNGFSDNQNQAIYVSRTGTEEVILSFHAYTLNDSSVIFNSG